MKKNRAVVPRKNVKVEANRRPDIRDDLDGRKTEEQRFKGDDVTHNAKDRHNAPKKHKH